MQINNPATLQQLVTANGVAAVVLGGNLDVKGNIYGWGNNAFRSFAFEALGGTGGLYTYSMGSAADINMRLDAKGSNGLVINRETVYSPLAVLDALGLSQTPVAGVIVPDHYITVNLNGVANKIPCVV